MTVKPYLLRLVDEHPPVNPRMQTGFVSRGVDRRMHELERAAAHDRARRAAARRLPASRRG